MILEMILERESFSVKCDGSHGDEEDAGGGAPVITEEPVETRKPRLQEPPKYAVLLYNDDYTTMEFVVEILQRYFRKTTEEAAQIMLRVHQQGKGVAGIYPHDIAETKVMQVTQYARARGFPLLCASEPLR